MNKVKLKTALDLIARNFDGLDKDVVKARYKKVLEVLATSKNLKEAAEKIGLSLPVFYNYVRLLKFLGLIKVSRGKEQSFELYVEVDND